MAKLIRERWTADEDAKMTRLYFAGHDWEHIAHALCRTPSSCQGRATQLSLARKKRLREKRGPHQSR